jgi:hypothetical protein
VKKGSVIVALAVSVLLGIGAAGAGASGTVPAKKRCHFVKKKVHGKIRRVRVCTKPKPKPAPKVLNVSLGLDSTHSASAVVGTAGGTITTQRADGSDVTLTVPAGALSASTKLTITPAASLAGLPKGLKLIAGVQLAPEGLALAQPASVSLEVGAGTAEGIAWFATGKAVSRYPSARDGSRLIMRVTHFSGVGAVQGPTSAYNNVPSAIAALKARYTSAVKPLLQQAVTNDEVVGAALDAAFGLMREVELLGLGSDFAKERAEIFEFLPKILQNALEQAARKCTDAHDLSQVERMLKLERLAELFGIHVAGPGALERGAKCLQFELDFDTVIRIDTGNGYGENHVRVGALKLHVAPDLSRITAQTQIDSSSGTIQPGCSTANGAGQAPFEVRNLNIAFTQDAEGNPIGPPKVTLDMNPGLVSITVDCGGTSAQVGFVYSTLWRWIRPDELVQGEDFTSGTYRIANWEYVGGAVLARKTYERSKPLDQSTVTESTTFVLRHTPDR